MTTARKTTFHRAVVSTRAMFILLLLLQQYATSAQPLAGLWDGIQLMALGKSHSPPATKTSIQIIGAGLGRTGTGSLQIALELLGYHSYHMIRAMEDPAHSKLWASVAKGEISTQAAFSFLDAEGFNATLDWPVVEYYLDQLDLYPQAKVILTVRDSATAWAKSYQTLIRLVRLLDAPFSWNFPNPLYVLFPTWARHNHELRCGIGRRLFQWDPCTSIVGEHVMNTTWLEQYYNKHVQNVLDTVPKDRLLTYNVKQGWEPLCQFLEVPVPPVPFPRLGEATLHRRFVVVFQIVVYAWIPVAMLIMLLLGRKLQRLLQLSVAVSIRKGTRNKNKTV